MRNNSIFLCLVFLFPITLFASIDFLTLLPNPIWDDTLGEYIEIRNIGCESIDIGGYQIYDASKKTYIFPVSTIIQSHESRQLPYSLTKIALNNSGIEAVTITDSWWNIIDTYEYSGTQKDNIIIQISLVDDSCEVILPTIETGSWIIWTNTGVVESGSIIIWENTWSIDISNTWNLDPVVTNSWNVDNSSWSLSDIEVVSTGSEIPIWENLWTGSFNSWIISDTEWISTGSIMSNIIYPDIIPTIQFPTNAIFSGSIFDCSNNLPCRINITFDPIFTGWLLMKDYICEVITESGSSTTCNPNTLYFSTGSLFTFRLTSKIDWSKSISKSWSVVYRAFEKDTLLVQSSATGELSPIELSNSGSINTLSWTVNTDIAFPEIILTVQNYTNTTNSWNFITCTTSPCRINFTLDPIFTDVYIAREYTCEIQYGTWVYASCNPPQLYPIWTWSIDITLTHKNSWQKINKVFQIIQNISPQTIIGNQGGTSPIVTDKNPPLAILEFDGKLRSYQEQVWEYEINCYTMTCSINLSAEKSYDPEWWKVNFLWYYWTNDIKTTADPWERKYWYWNHEIWLRVIDSSANVSHIRYYIHVLGEREKVNEIKVEKKLKTKGNWNIKKAKKVKKVTFFDPPIIELQNKKFIENDNTYICYTKTNNCSLNLSLWETQKWITYRWIYEDGEIVESKNPKSKSFVPGIHTIRLIAGYSSDNFLWDRIIQVKVIKIQKPKKIKKTKQTKIVHMSWSIIDSNTKNTQLSDTKKEEKTDDSIPYAMMAIIGGIVPLITLRKWLIWLISKT